MKKFFTILTFFLFISLNAHSLEKAIFPFTIDEQVQDYKEDENIISIESKELNSDKYWNTPLTRLDYILFQLKKAADKNQNKLIKVYSDGSSLLRSNFERYENLKKSQEFFGKYKEPQVKNNIFFDEKKGKIVVMFQIDDVGKPKKPMKEICAKILDLNIIGSWGMPDQKMSGYLYHNTLLNELFRGGDFDDYTEHLQKIADNIAYALSITSTISNSLEKRDEDVLSMTCFKLSNNNEIDYRKRSYKFKE